MTILARLAWFLRPYVPWVIYRVTNYRTAMVKERDLENDTAWKTTYRFVR